MTSAARRLESKGSGRSLCHAMKRPARHFVLAGRRRIPRHRRCVRYFPPIFARSSIPMHRSFFKQIKYGQARLKGKKIAPLIGGLIDREHSSSGSILASRKDLRLAASKRGNGGAAKGTHITLQSCSCELCESWRLATPTKAKMSSSEWHGSFSPTLFPFSLHCRGKKRGL